jgi:hypothetical protein
LTIDEETELISAIDAGKWKSNRTGSRRIQMFGPEHDKSYKIHANASVTPLPEYCRRLIAKIKSLQKECQGKTSLLQELELDKLGIDRLTEPFVNEYTDKDALRFHQDHRSTYGPVIMGISMLGECFLSFKRSPNAKSAERIHLPRRSIYFMTGASRYEWYHGIMPGDIKAARRLSVTLRMVNEAKIVFS